MEDNFEATKKIIKRIFDVQQRQAGKRGAQLAKGVKEAYLLHFLQEHWEEICGPALAKNCSILKLQGQVLTIRTANSLLANELFMMKKLFLQKINAFLLGQVVVKDLLFTATGQVERYTRQEGEAFETPHIEVQSWQERKCPRCGARMHQGDEYCTVCQRQLHEELELKLGEILRLEPWLTYENCLNYYKCDKITFTAVKDRLKNFYYERVRLGFADEQECRMAVLFLLGEHPAEIDEKSYNNALEYLRRNQYVSTSGLGLYGKK